MLAESTHSRLAVAGIPFVHQAESGIEVPDRITLDWPGSEVAAAPILVKHSVADTAPAGLTPLVQAPIALGDYLLDRRGHVAVRSRVAETPGFRPQLLLTSVPGYEYELHYVAPSDSRLLEWGWHRTILMLALPMRRAGLLVHATGFLLDDGTAVLCPSISGGGKSTLARQLFGVRDRPPVTVLSDDRVALTADGGDLRVWGTPWHSSAGASSAESGALRCLVFIGRAERSRLTEISAADALRRILRTIGMPFWDAGATDYSLALIDRVMSSVPCFEYGYTPGGTAGADLLRALQTR